MVTVDMAASVLIVSAATVIITTPPVYLALRRWGYGERLAVVAFAIFLATVVSGITSSALSLSLASRVPVYAVVTYFVYRQYFRICYELFKPRTV